MNLPMEWTSILAIYVLFWVLCGFVMLPFGIRTPDEGEGITVAGQADSAPTNFNPGQVAIRATVLAGVLTSLYVVNYAYGWIEAEDLILWGPKRG